MMMYMIQDHWKSTYGQHREELGFCKNSKTLKICNGSQIRRIHVIELKSSFCLVWCGICGMSWQLCEGVLGSQVPQLTWFPSGSGNLTTVLGMMMAVSVLVWRALSVCLTCGSKLTK